MGNKNDSVKDSPIYQLFDEGSPIVYICLLIVMVFGWWYIIPEIIIDTIEERKKRNR